MGRIGSTAAVAAMLGLFALPAAAHESKAQAATTSVSLPAGPTREAAAVVDAFHAALTRGDQGAAAALLADTALIYEGGAVERSKTEYQSHHLPADAAFASATSRVLTARHGFAQGGLAYISSEGRTSGQYKSKTIDELTTETMVLRETAGAWRIVHIHWSSRAAKK